MKKEKLQKLIAEKQDTTRERNEHWAQGVAEGWIDPDAKKQWMATSSSCPTCLALDGKTVALNEDFPFGDPPLLACSGGPYEGLCRCTVNLVDDEIPEDIASMTEEELDAELDSLLSKIKKKKKKVFIDAGQNASPIVGKKKKKKIICD